MIELKGVTFGFGAQELMRDVGLQIREGDRLGLVGPNGSGKTTLLRIIHGRIRDFEGEVSRRRDTTTGLLPQEGIYEQGRTVFDAALETFADLIEAERHIQDLNERLEKDPADAALLEQSGRLQHEYETRGGFTFRARTAEVLTGLGFIESDFQRDMSEFSGGWQMRVALARLLLRAPDALLLDEPTNHLDLPARLWFEDFIRTYPGAVLLISHDPCFLDNIVTRIAEFSNRKLELYSGNYSRYRVEKEQRLEILRNRKQNQDRIIRQNERFIERFRYKNTKARSVQSRVKMLDRLERIELPASERTLNFSFKTRQRSGKMVMRLDGVNKSYGEKRVLRHVNLTVDRGERIAIIGANGLGKTTLMRVLADRTDFTGERTPGHNVTINYFSQDQYELLNPDQTVLEEAESSCGSGFNGSVRTLLGVFLFTGDDVDKKVQVLSGGEKSRLLLARLMADPANFLLLDEPTNHLDPPSQDMLQNVLVNYDGTLCFVSHDRYFIESVATRIVEITRHGIEEYLGGYEDYEIQKKQREQAREQDEADPDDEAEPTPAADRKARRRARAEFVAARARALNPIRDRIRNAEAQIQELEERAAEIEAVLSDPATYTDAEKTKTLPAELRQVQDRLERTLSDWEAACEELETAEAGFQNGEIPGT